jgi:hypothetical protein
MCVAPQNYKIFAALQALTRWGGALLEMAHFSQGQDAVDKIEEVGLKNTS